MSVNLDSPDELIDLVKATDDSTLQVTCVNPKSSHVNLVTMDNEVITTNFVDPFFYDVDVKVNDADYLHTVAIDEARPEVNFKITIVDFVSSLMFSENKLIEENSDCKSVLNLPDDICTQGVRYNAFKNIFSRLPPEKPPDELLSEVDILDSNLEEKYAAHVINLVSTSSSRWDEGDSQMAGNNSTLKFVIREVPSLEHSFNALYYNLDKCISTVCGNASELLLLGNGNRFGTLELCHLLCVLNAQLTLHWPKEFTLLPLLKPPDDDVSSDVLCWSYKFLMFSSIQDYELARVWATKETCASSSIVEFGLFTNGCYYYIPVKPPGVKYYSELFRDCPYKEIKSLYAIGVILGSYMRKVHSYIAMAYILKLREVGYGATWDGALAYQRPALGIDIESFVADYSGTSLRTNTDYMLLKEYWPCEVVKRSHNIQLGSYSFLEPRDDGHKCQQTYFQVGFSTIVTWEVWFEVCDNPMEIPCESYFIDCSTARNGGTSSTVGYKLSCYNHVVHLDPMCLGSEFKLKWPKKSFLLPPTKPLDNIVSSVISYCEHAYLLLSSVPVQNLTKIYKKGSTEFLWELLNGHVGDLVLSSANAQIIQYEFLDQKSLGKFGKVDSILDSPLLLDINSVWLADRVNGMDIMSSHMRVFDPGITVANETDGFLLTEAGLEGVNGRFDFLKFIMQCQSSLFFFTKIMLRPLRTMLRQLGIYSGASSREICGFSG